ncbi:MAG TPA: hypothetical protein VL400_02910 [Polyangiaceae bacterium]|nr:hypothetical protein [Polyangiaceae bacterium]
MRRSSPLSSPLGARAAAAALLALGAAAPLGCSDTTETEATREVPTAVVVDPSLFLGTLPCADIEGAPRSFRATLVDLDSDKTLGPSPRSSCGGPVFFDAIEAGHHYMAQIEVFDVPVDEAAGTPTWTTTCGADGNGAAVPRINVHVTVGGCIPLPDTGSATTSVLVDPSKAKGALECEADGGPLGPLDVVPSLDSGLPTVTLACDGSPITYGSGITAGTRYDFRIDSDAGYATTCSAVARAGLVIPATCGALTNLGSLTFPIPDLESSASLACGTDVERATIELTAGPQTAGPRIVDCGGPVTLSGLEAGSYVGTVTLDGGSAPAARFACTGSVAPATESSLVCTPEN